MIDCSLRGVLLACVIAVAMPLVAGAANPPPPGNQLLTTQYVHHETQRCVQGVLGQAKVYSGIGFDVPWHGEQGVERFPSDSENVYNATHAALQAGASGVVASREYDEMRRENLQAFGRAVRSMV